MIKKLAPARNPIARQMIAIVVAASLVAACGSESPSDSPMAGPRPAGEPIKIGFLSYTLGASPISGAPPGQEAAVKRLNEKMNGINGRPVDFDVCQVDATPETNIRCANQFVRDNVVAVVDGFDPGSGAVLPILAAANIPLVGSVSYSSQADADQKSFYFGAGQAPFGIGPLKIFKDQGFKKVALAQRDVASSHSYFEKFVTPAAQALGLEFKPVYFPPQNPEFQLVGAALAATQPDVAGTAGLSSAGQCADLVKGARTAGFTKTIFAGFCTSFGANADLANVQIYSSVWLPQMKSYAPAAMQEQLTTAQADITALNAKSVDFYTYATYATTMNLASALKNITGTVDGPAVSQALLAMKNVQGFLGPMISCDHTAWPNSSTCSNSLIVAQFNSDGSLKPLGGGFQAISPSIMPSH